MSIVVERVIPSPVGLLTLVATDTALAGVRFDRTAAAAGVCVAAAQAGHPVLDLAAREIGEYFAGARQTFSIPLAPAGTPFQRAVWQALETIPFGERRSYAWLAGRIGDARACRAVGAANGRNPLPIVLPCHRVVGADGRLTGYAGGLDRKRWLLAHERSSGVSRLELSGFSLEFGVPDGSPAARHRTSAVVGRLPADRV
jgi:methylated-DNA-[protein]-cysteine S-methyltransferase